jgi:phosphohistidine phosphatase
MKRLIVFRHAKSSWDDAGLDDHDRPLAARGEHDAPEMAQRIAASDDLARAVLVTSTARRALATADALVAAAEPAPDLVRDERLYLASPRTILAVLATQPDTADTIVLVGHNPGLTQLVNLLLPNLDLANLPTAGVVCMSLPIASWADIDRGPAALTYCDFPKTGRTTATV